MLFLLVAAAVHAAPACPTGASTSTTITQPFNNVTSAGDSLLIVKTGAVAVPTLKSYGAYVGDGICIKPIISGDIHARAPVVDPGMPQPQCTQGRLCTRIYPW